MGIQIVVGNPARGENFYNREDLLKKIWSVLQESSILLAAPRRIGKTSLMHHLYDKPIPGFKVLFFDAEDYNAPEDFVTELILKAGELHRDPRSIARKILAHFKENIDALEIWEIRIELRKQMGSRWREEGQRAIESLIEDENKALIIIDELPVFLHKLISNSDPSRRALALDFLDWLRHLRLQPAFNLRLRQLVGGSIGLPRIASYLGASAKINDLRQIDVQPLDRDNARELARALFSSRGISLPSETMECFMDQIGTFIPIFIQIMTSVLATEMKEQTVEATPELIRHCYEYRALGSEFRICFEDYYERLDRYYTPTEAKAAKRILRELALTKESLSKSTLLGHFLEEIGNENASSQFELLLTWLRDDFYVEEDTATGKITFRVKWLRDWWRKYHATDR